VNKRILAVGRDKKWSKYSLVASKHPSKLLCRVVERYHDGLDPGAGTQNAEGGWAWKPISRAYILTAL